MRLPKMATRRPMARKQASKGRAAYIGERSLGHQDPGATTIMLMIQAMHKVAVDMNVE